MKDSYFANTNIKTFTDDSKMFGRGKIGKRKLIKAKTKKSRATVPLTRVYWTVNIVVSSMSLNQLL